MINLRNRRASYFLFEIFLTPAVNLINILAAFLSLPVSLFSQGAFLNLIKNLSAKIFYLGLKKSLQP